jgi:hypothetical protein
VSLRAGEGIEPWVGPYRVVDVWASGARGAIASAVRAHDQLPVTLREVDAALLGLAEALALGARVDGPAWPSRVEVVPDAARARVTVVEHARPGDTLAAIADGPEQWPTWAWLEAAREAARALAPLHAQVEGGARRWAHGCLHARNVLVGVVGGVALLDLGLSRLTPQRWLGGLAPEVALGEAPTPASDVFSIATWLWEGLARRPLFEAGRADATARLLVEAERPRLAEFMPLVPRGLDALLQAALAAAPSARPRDGQALAAGIDHILAGMGVDPGPEALSKLVERRRRRSSLDAARRAAPPRRLSSFEGRPLWFPGVAPADAPRVAPVHVSRASAEPTTTIDARARFAALPTVVGSVAAPPPRTSAGSPPGAGLSTLRARSSAPAPYGRATSAAPPSGSSTPADTRGDGLALQSLSDYLYDARSGEFTMPYLPDARGRREVLGSTLELRFADGAIEELSSFGELLHVVPRHGSAPRVVRRRGAAWIDFGRFARLLGADVLVDDGRPLEQVVEVGSLRPEAGPGGIGGIGAGLAGELDASGLRATSLVALLAELARRRASGRLVIVDPLEPRAGRRLVELRQGAPVYVGAPTALHHHGELLVAAGLVRRDELGDLLLEVARRDEPLDVIVARRKRVDPRELRLRLADAFRWSGAKFALDADATGSVDGPLAPSLLALCLSGARRSTRPELLRRHLEPKQRTRYLAEAGFADTVAQLELGARLTELALVFARRETLAEVARERPDELGAILLLAYLLLEVGAIRWSS